MSVRQSRVLWVLIGLACLVTMIPNLGCKESGGGSLPMSTMITGPFTQTTSGVVGTVSTPLGSGTIPAASLTTTVEVASGGTYNVKGAVYDSVKGTPIPAAKISLDDLTGNTSSTFTYTDGTFILNGIKVGVHSVLFRVDDFQDFSFSFEMDSSGNLKGWKTALLSPKLYVIKGKVLAQGSSANPVSNAVVTMQKLDKGVSVATYSTMSSSNGEFMFTDQPVGFYAITAGGQNANQASIQVEIGKNGALSPSSVVIYVSPNIFRIIGTVCLSNTLETLPNITVIASSVSLGAPKVSKTTAEGKFILEDMPVGVFDLGFYDDASGAKYTPATYTVQILSDGTISPESPKIYLFKAPETGNTVDASGTVRDAFTGAPIEYVTINLKGFASVLSDKFGKFSFGSIPVGTYELEMTKLGFQNMKGTFTVKKVEGTNKVYLVPAKLDYLMVYNQETEKGSIVGRYVSVANNEEIDNCLVHVIRMKAYFIGTELRGYYLPNTIQEIAKSTRTSSGTSGIGAELLGSFKVTHIDPNEPFSSTAARYAVVVMKKNTPGVIPSFSPATWTLSGIQVPGQYPTAGTYLQVWPDVQVKSNTSTFITNYDPGFGDLK